MRKSLPYINLERCLMKRPKWKALNFDSKRLNEFGKMLRRSRIWMNYRSCFNIIGEMSIIGPRPLLIKYLPYY